MIKNRLNYCFFELLNYLILKMVRQYYTTKDVLKKVGISRNTLFLWFKYKKIPEVRRNRNGHRIFTKQSIQKILNYKNKLILPQTE